MCQKMHHLVVARAPKATHLEALLPISQLLDLLADVYDAFALALLLLFRIQWPPRHFEMSFFSARHITMVGYSNPEIQICKSAKIHPDPTASPRHAGRRP